MKIFRTLMLASAFLCAASAVAQGLSEEDYCDPRVSAPKRIREMRPMADGVSYTAISPDGRSIGIFSYKTGKQTGTLFSLDNQKGDVKISEFSGYALSADEKKVMLWNDVTPIYRRSFTAQYFVYDVMRSTLKRVSDKGRQRGATLSHDGRMVCYMREDNNLYISNLDYGTDIAITNDGKPNSIINGCADWVYEEELTVVNTMRWSADDQKLAYVRFDETDVPTYRFDNIQSYCTLLATQDLYPAQLAYKYPLPGYPNSKVSVKVYDVNNRTTKTMDLPIGETDYVPSLEFDGDGTSLMAMILNRDQNHLRLFKVNPGSTVAKQILTETSDGWLEPDAYQLVDYGKTSFMIASERSGWRHLYEYSYTGQQLRQITSGDFNVTDYYGRNAAGDVFVQCTKLGAINRNVARVDRKGTLTLLHDQAGTESAAFSRTFDYYVRTWSDANTPPQYTVWSARGQKVADLELNKEYAAKYANAPRKEFITVKNAAGQEMNGYVMRLPQAGNEVQPLIMLQYNGPGSQTVLNQWKMAGETYLASLGYTIGCVDGRGTGGRSREYAQCVYRHLGDFETADQIAGAREIARRPDVDENRMGCFGWSYGGYMTLMELTDPNTPFIAGVSMAPVTDWRFYDSTYTERFMSTPQQNPEGYEKASTLGRTQNLKNSRLLIMSGTSDDNVHFYNTLKFTSKLNFEGKLFDMMAFTGFEHSLPLCNARVMLYRRAAEFYDYRLRKAAK